MTDDGERFAGWDFGEDLGIALFARRCPRCSRWIAVTTPPVAKGDGLASAARGRCGRHGDQPLPFQGFFSRDELGTPSVAGG